MTASAEVSELPESWAEVRLGAHAEIVMGQAPPKSDCNAYGDGVPFVKVGEFGAEMPLVREWTTNPLRTARISDVLVCVVGATAGKVNRGIDCSIGRSVAAVRPSSELSAGYLFQFLSFMTPSLRAGAQGSAQGVIKKRDLEEQVVPIPPLPEQQCIVEILEEQLSRLDAALDSVRMVRQKAGQFRRSLLNAAFTGALTEGSWSRWRMVPLSDHVRSRSGDSKLIKGKQSSNPSDGLVQGYSASGPDVWVADTHYEEVGVVVSAVGARCGKTFLARPPWTAIANTHALVPDGQIDARYLWHLTNREDWWIKSGTAQPFVKVKDTLARPTPLPPLPEQERLVGLVEGQLASLDASLATADAVEKQAAELRRSLLHAAFTGRLTEQWRKLAHV